MRTLALLLLFAAPAFGAPVPKELRQPSIIGSWVIVGAKRGGIEQKDYHGQRWTFGENGSFSNPSYPTGGTYAIRPGGIDFDFGGSTNSWMALAEFDRETLRVAFHSARDNRASDFTDANNSIVYTFKRAKE